MPSDGHIVVGFSFVTFLNLVENLFKMLVIDTANHIAIHIDQSAISIVGKSFFAGGIGQADDRFVVESQDSRSCSSCRASRTPHRNGPKQAVASSCRRISCRVLFPRSRHSCLTSSIKPAGSLLATFIVEIAHLGSDREAWRDGKPDASHFSQVGTFATQERFLLAVAFGLGLAEVVDHLGGFFFCHLWFPSDYFLRTILALQGKSRVSIDSLIPTR